MTVLESARNLTSLSPDHPVLSLYLDLDPERFATPPARATQIQSLTDEAARMIDRDDTLEHDDVVGLREDVERVRRYLCSREPPFQGSRGLAVFCSGREDLFEVVQLNHPVEGQVLIARRPFVEPLVLRSGRERWCVALVNRRDARVFAGRPEKLTHRGEINENVHGQHQQGGWSQARYERSVDRDAENHFRHVAEEIEKLYRREPFDRLALGGPQEALARFEEALSEELRGRLVPARVEVDISSANDNQIQEAVAAVVRESDRARERELLERMAEGIGSGGRGAGGLEEVLRALTERRVETLLLEPTFEASGGRCPTCGLLTLERGGECPADGSELEPVDQLREAMVEAALLQDADVVVLDDETPDLGPFRGVGAVLRF